MKGHWNAKILVIDDSEEVRRSVQDTLKDPGIQLVLCRTAREAFDVLEKEEIDVVISDVHMSDVDGFAFLERALKVDPNLDVIFTAGISSIRDAVDSVRRGAAGYIPKPFDPIRFFETVQEVLADRRLESAGSSPKLERAVEPILGRSPLLLDVLPLIGQFAEHSTTVLLRGETGCGKELVARAIHDAGPRSNEPYIVCNCSAFSDTLMENEFFGHAKGAFTDADDTRPGLYETADGGVLFLDEIGDLPLVSQAKLLRILENGEVQRIGEAIPRKADVQIIAATNKDLAEEVRAGRFRKDLYYRLNVAQITLPPLRDRKDDIPTLVDKFLSDAAEEYGKAKPAIATETNEALLAYAWPGNVRELRNVLFRVMLFHEGESLTLEALPDEVQAARSDDSTSGDTSLDTVRREHIQRVLEELGGNKSEAAQILGVSRVTLYRELQRYGL